MPAVYNPSIESIRERFDILGLPDSNKAKIGERLYHLFAQKFDPSHHYHSLFEQTLKLSNIGKVLTIYHKDRHASYIAMQELNYGFSHQEMVLISLLLYTKTKRGYHKALYKEYRSLLPSKKCVKWLAFLYSLTLILHKASAKTVPQFTYRKDRLIIRSHSSLYLAREDITLMKKPKGLKIILE